MLNFRWLHLYDSRRFCILVYALFYKNDGGEGNRAKMEVVVKEKVVV
jgi:hypothetical protein